MSFTTYIRFISICVNLQRPLPECVSGTLTTFKHSESLVEVSLQSSEDNLLNKWTDSLRTRISSGTVPCRSLPSFQWHLFDFDNNPSTPVKIGTVDKHNKKHVTPFPLRLSTVNNSHRIHGPWLGTYNDCNVYILHNRVKPIFEIFCP